MATTPPIVEKKTPTTTDKPIQLAQAAPAKTLPGKALASKNSVLLDVLRKDIGRVEIVDTDFVVTTKSGRKILIRDGALNAVTDEEFSVTFANAEEVPGKVFFSEAETSSSALFSTNWSDAKLAESTAALVVPAAASGISLTTVGLGALAAAALGGGGGGGGSPPPADTSTAAKNALDAIGKFAKDNVESQPTSTGAYIGPAPTLRTYDTAGIKGVASYNLSAINDALATASVTDVSVNTTAKLQALVDAYNAIINLANGQINPNAPKPTADQYTLIGLTGLETQDPLRDVKASLLGDVIDRKILPDVDTVKEIQALESIVNAVMDAAKGGRTLTKSQLDTLGLNGVTDANFGLILDAINATPDNGTGVDTLGELQGLVDTINGGASGRDAVNLIADFADLNTLSQPIVPGSFLYKGIPPTAQIYVNAGITGTVTVADAAAFNDALATAAVTRNSVDTLEKVQALVDAYRKVFALADGIGNNSIDQQPTLNDYQLLGVDTSNLQASPARLKLLNDIIDGQVRDGVDRIAEINQLVTVANAIQDFAGGGSSTLTPSQLATAGIHGVTADNLKAFLDAIVKAGTIGADTVQELQSLLYNSLTLRFDAISEDRGFSSTDFITNDNTLIFSGSSSAADGTKIRVTLKRANQTDIITLDGEVKSGLWQMSSGTTLADGDYTVTAQLIVGTTGGPSPVTFAQHVVIDTQVDPATDPVNKSIAITGVIDDTGAQDTGPVITTSDTTLIYKGTSTAANGTHVAVKIDGVVQWTTVQDGQWSLDNTGQTLKSGDHTVEAYLTDVAGNQVGNSVAKTVHIDLSGLTLLSRTSGPIGSASNLVLKFSAAVNAVAGKTIVLTDLSSPGSPWATIAVTDTTQVTIAGDTVTINPTNDLIKGHQYRATIDNGAFTSTTGATYEGLSVNADWTFTAVDPSMEVTFAGTGINVADGINQAELASNNLVVRGKIASTNLDVISNARITKITFTSADGVGSFEVTTGLPTVDSSFNWVLPNNASWVGQLVSGKTYTVSAQLDASISGAPIQPVIAQSLAVLVDKDAPVLVKIECDKTSLKLGDLATFTFTFSEDPKDSFTLDDLILAQVGTQKVGSFLAMSGSGLVRTALFRATEGVTFTSSSALPTVKVNAGSFIDTVGNPGVIAPTLAFPPLIIDTQGPTVSSVVISGIQTKTPTSNEITSGTLVDGDKIRVTVTMNEVVQVTGFPTFSIQVGSALRTATYVRGGGTNALVFEYTVAIGDADSDGGITAAAKSLSLGSARIIDLFDNPAVLDTTPAVDANANHLVVLTNGSINALKLIQDFADANKDPFNLVNTVVVPTLQNYIDAGVKGVTADNLGSINNSLATAVIDATRIGSLQALQDLVTAYNQILTLADGTNNTANADNPNALQYQLIGVQGVDTVRASLLGDVIDFKQKAEVDTVAEIQDLANAVSAVMDQAKNISGLSLDQLQSKLNIQGVTADNFAAVTRAIANSPDDGSGVNTWDKLQALVSDATNKASTALKTLKIFAQLNEESLPVTSATGNYAGVIPTWSVYLDAGITSVPGITDTNLTTLVNDALATRLVDEKSVSTAAQVQSIVNAYGAIANLANGRSDTTDQPDAAAYNLIGVTGFDNAVTSKSKASLLSDVIDRKVFDDINTVKEIQALADAAAAVMANAAGTGSVTADQLKALGFDVPANKINDVVAAIAASKDDGTEVDTFAELSKLINSKLDAVDQAVRQIADFADQNTVSIPTPTGGFVYKGTAPTAATYNSVGLTGGTVSDAEAASFNDALATSGVTYTSVDTKEEVQALVDAYRAVRAAADGQATPALTKPTLAQYGLLGVTNLEDTQDAVATASRVRLLGEVIDRKNVVDVDTVLELQALANAVVRVITQAKSSLDTVSTSDLSALGIQGANADNLSAVLQAIRGTDDNGTGVDTVDELQALVTGSVSKFNASLLIIQNYAKNHTDPTQLGTDQPTVQNYLDLGLTTVNSSNVKSFNSALATASVTDAQVATTQAVRDVVNAYLEILAAADGTPDSDPIASKDYSLLGITGVGGSDVKTRLLSDVIDRKLATGVDTADELQALADKVTAVMNTAAKSATGGLTSAQQLIDLGINNVTTDNFAKVLAAIQTTAADGTGVDTVKELQDLVNNVVGSQAKSLQVLIDFAQLNTVSQPLTGTGFSYQGVVPTAQTYVDAGVTGTVSTADAASLNDVLATNAITGNSVNDLSKLQAMVDAYRKVFALADGPSNPTTGVFLSADEWNRLGVEPSVTGVNRLNLLGDIVDRQSRSDVDTVAKLNQLSLIANAVQDQASGLTPSRSLTVSDFSKLGLRGVSDSNLTTFLSAIKGAGAAGSDTVSELQSLLFDNLTLNFKSISDDTGPANNDFITNDNTLILVGESNAADGTKVRVILKRSGQLDLQLDGTVTNKTWQVVTPSALTDGDYTVNAQLYDGLNPLPKVFIFAQHVVIDTSIANRPDGTPDSSLAGKTATLTGITTDTGNVGDFKTSDTTLIFSGTSTAGPGAYVAISVKGGPLVYAAVQADGTWQADNTAQTLVDGTYTVKVYLADSAGNITDVLSQQDVTIETTGLRLVTQTSGPIASSAPLKLTFSTDVVAKAGKFIHLTDESTGSVVDIAVTDNSQVAINGSLVTLTPTGANRLVAGKSYHATIDADAFASVTGTSFQGVLGLRDWTFQTVDPSTTVTFSGTGVDATNGLNAAEIAVANISGVVSSPSFISVSNPKVTKLTFNSTDGLHSFVVTTSLSVGADRTWSLANASSWTGQLISGKTYTVSAQLESDINGTHQTTSFSSAQVLVDTVAPALTITTAATQLTSAQPATLITFTFDEPPTGFTQSDIDVTKVNGVAIGSLSEFTATADPKVFTVKFTAASGLTVPAASLVSVVKSSYTDAVGNTGKSDASAPTVLIDTQGPTVTAVTISGVNGSNVAKTTTLDVGDKIKITLTLSETTTVDARSTPIFNFDLGGVTKTAVYDSGSGSTSLVFYYTIAQGDNDNVGGITSTANSLSLALLQDALGNTGSLSTPAVIAGANTVVVDTTASALASLAAAAQANNASSTITPLTLYQKAGATRLDANNLAAYNSALNSAAVTGTQADTTAEVQGIVDAYNTILKLADGGITTSTFATDQQYQLIGVTGLDNPTTVQRSDKAQLLSDVIDRKAFADVDTVPEVQALADAVIGVMKAANGVVSGADALTRAQLESLGIVRVTDNNLAAVLSAIAATADDGTAVNTLAKLQAVVDQGANKAQQDAITLISNFAAFNVASSNTGTASFSYSGTKPSLSDYVTAGVTGVTAGNIDAINDALATASVDGASTSTAVGIQRVVDAYRAVLALADGSSVANGTAIKATQFSDIGASLGSAFEGSSNLKLLNNVLDFKSTVDVDTVQEINDLASIVNAIMDSTSNRQTTSAALLTVANLTKLGLTSVTSTNLAGIVASIAAQPNGNNMDSRAKLQALVDFYNAPAPTVALVTDTGVSNQDSQTNNANLNFGAAGTSGASAFVSLDGGKTYVLTSAFVPPSSSGTYTAMVRQVSAEGYLGQARSLSFTYDITLPEALKLKPGSSTDTVYYGANSFGVTNSIAPAMQQVNDSDVAVITLVAGGLNAALDRITLNVSSQVTLLPINADTTILSSTIGSVTGVNIRYTASTQTFEFSSDNSRSSRAFTSAEVLQIERALGFSTNSQASSTRTFKFSHTDVAGNSNASAGSATVTVTIDNTPPSKLLFSNTTQQSSSFYNSYNKAATLPATVTIAPNLVATADTDIAQIQLKLGGAGLDVANNRLIFGDGATPQTLDLRTDSSGTGLTIGGVSGVGWRYTASSQTLVFSLDNGGVLDGTKARSIETALQFTIPTAATGVKSGAVTFTFDHIDPGGLSTQTNSNGATQTIMVDLVLPVTVDLDSATAALVDTTFNQFFNATLLASNTALAFMPKVARVTDTDIASIAVKLGGAGLDVANDVLLIDGTVVALTGGANKVFGSAQTIAGVSGVDWSYDRSTQVLLISKSDSTVFTAAQLQAIEVSLSFKATANSRQGDRTFLVQHVDSAGNFSAISTATVTVDTVAPTPVDLSDTAAGVQNTLTPQQLNATNVLAGVAIAPSMNRAATDEGVSTVQLVVSGAIDGANDKLVIGSGASSLTVDLSAANQSGAGATIGSVTGVSWSYAASSRTFTFSKPSGVWTAAEVQTIERTLFFASKPSASAGTRFFSFSHIDLAGNVSASATSAVTNDTTAPLLSLTPSAPNYQVITTNPQSPVFLTNSGATVTEAGNIANVQIRVRGLRSGASEKIVVNGTTEIDASGGVTSGTAAVTGSNAATWNWTYNSAIGAFLFSVANASGTAAQAEALLRSLSYKTSTGTTDDVRQFFVKATDIAGNTSSEVVSSVVVNGAAPAKFASNPVTAIDGNGDGTKGDQFVLTFTEPVKVSSLTDLSKWAISGGGSLGLGASARPVDAVIINNETYATNFVLTVGVGGNVLLGQEKTLTLTGANTGASTNGSVALPTLTLTSQSITLEAWVYANYDAWPTTGNGFQRIFDFGTKTALPTVSVAQPGVEMWLGFNSTTGKLEFEFIKGADTDLKKTQGQVIANTALALKSWQHVALTFSGSTATLYLNGEALTVGTGANQVTVFNSAGATSANGQLSSGLDPSVNFLFNYIGKSNWSEDAGFNGNIFDARVYSDARTAAEIKNDYGRQIDLKDSNLLLQYDFDGNLTNAAAGTTGGTFTAGGSRNGTSSTSGVAFGGPVGTTLTVTKDAVEDAGQTKAAADQQFQLLRKTLTSGTAADDSLTGSAGNDFIAGQGGNDTLTGAGGADIFAWLAGDRGTDMVTDFKVALGDMIDLSGILSASGLSALSTDADLRKYLQLTKVGNDEVLRIDSTGQGNFVTPTKTINFASGALNGLDDSLTNLVKSKVINVDKQTSTPLVLDLNGDGVHTTTLTKGVAFDNQGTGQLLKTAWTDGKDGLLVLDLNHDGFINSGRELFGSNTLLANGSTAKDGLKPCASTTPTTTT
jgi:ribosome maturation factor RimP